MVGGVVAGPVSSATLVTGPNVVNVSMNATPPDEGDGVDEDPLVDGNGDGTPDAQQPNVTTLDAGVGGGDVTIAAPSDQYALEAVSTGPVPSGAPDADFPIGLVGFAVKLPTGATIADVKIVLPPGTNPNAWFEYEDATWFQFTHVTIVGDTITLHLTDGGIGDDDGVVNGTIVDPGLAGVGYTFHGFRRRSTTTNSMWPRPGKRCRSSGGSPTETATPSRTRRASRAFAPRAVRAPGACWTRWRPCARRVRPPYSGNGEWQFNWKTDKAWAVSAGR